MLPEDALLEIFDWQLGDNDFYNIEGWQTLVHVCRNSKVAKRSLRVTTPPEAATFLHRQEAREEDSGYLATVSYHHIGLLPPNYGRR
jgi:hypothetical protein